MKNTGQLRSGGGGLMKAHTLTFAGAVALAIAWVGAALHAQQAAADLVLTNGKIVTVDEKFTIAQAVAVKGDRIIAVGTTQQIDALAGPNTRRIDLKGKAVLPGLIDSHAHLWRAAATWEEELRLDGVDARNVLVIDRDYLTVPESQIKDIKPLMTILGGRVVYDAGLIRTSSLVRVVYLGDRRLMRTSPRGSRWR